MPWNSQDIPAQGARGDEIKQNKSDGGEAQLDELVIGGKV